MRRITLALAGCAGAEATLDLLIADFNEPM
jgi:hypothetical protein